MIADLSVNHVERFLLRGGCAVRRTEPADYGVDLVATTFDPAGEIENGGLLFQLKATDRPSLLADGKAVAVTIALADLKYWLGEPDPLFLVVYDASRDRAFWVYVQRYVDEKGIDIDDIEGQTIRLRVPVSNRLNDRAVRRFREWKNAIRARTGRVDHGS